MQIRQHEQLVPEHMPAICLAVQTPSRYAHVEIGCVRGEGLEDVERVQARAVVGIPSTPQVEVALRPQVGPSAGVRGQQLVEGRGKRRFADRCGDGVADCGVTAGVDGDNLLDGDLLSAANGERQVLSHALPLCPPAPFLCRPAVGDPRPSGHGDTDP